MNKLTFLILLGFFTTLTTVGQTISDLINEVNQDTLVKVVREFSGEDATVVVGNAVTILNRVSSSDNNLAAEYLLQKLNTYNNLTITDQVYSAGGRNIIATQLGKTNPNNIYIVCAHYDSVANYCTDDNASGTTAVLEVARILSTQCFDNTIIYALWDEEEVGLKGADFYASQAAANGDNILGVLNLDMMAYDGDGDNDFDIDVRNIAGSLVVKDDIISALNTYGFNLNVNVVDPGTTASDHSMFWSNGYPAVLMGESWFNNDQTPDYHTAGDRFSTLDMDYFTDMTKLVLAYIATKASLLPVDSIIQISFSGGLQTPNLGATFQWLDCDNNMAIIPGETTAWFEPPSNGHYAVEVTLGSCVEISKCFNYTTFSTNEFDKSDIEIYPNPVNSILNIDLQNKNFTLFKLVTLEGKEILKLSLEKLHNEINLSQFSMGIYFVNLETDGKTISFKIVKE